MTHAPATAGALSPELLLGLVERAGRADFPAFEAQLRSSGNCARPIRLRGTIETCDGQGHKRVWSTKDEPDGVLRKACGNRREAVCPPCAERYRQDAYHLVGAGLRGGKGVPDTVSGHPAVFLTLTAPSFGPVHTRRLGADGQPRPCRPRRDRPVCEHGRPLCCTAVHGEDDACLGEPLCRECWDYQGAVVWNHTLGKLWRHTTMKIKRGLAREAGMTQKRFNRRARPAYAKVAEYQQRGLVHLHVLVRLDRAMPDYRSDQVRPPARRFTVEQLEQAIRTAIEEVSAPVDDEHGGGRVCWGGMLDIAPLQTGDQRAEIAGYLAKYSTKSTEQAGGLLHRIDADDIDTAPVREHVKDYMRTAFALNAQAVRYRKQHPPDIEPSPAPDVETDWQPAALLTRVQCAMGTDEPLRVRLHDGTVHTGRAVRLTTGPERADTTQVVELDDGELVHLGDVASIGAADCKQRRDPPPPRLAACAHAFGYRGHCLTKSQRYSTTFKQLRADREAWVHEQILARSRDATQRALAAAVERTVKLEIDGIGHVTASDTHYALSEHARARERRRIGREEYGDQSSRAIKARRRATGQAPVGEDESDREAARVKHERGEAA
jgi:hypothetical protein